MDMSPEDGSREPREVLKELDGTMDDLLVKMEAWKERLGRMVDGDDEEAIVKEAGKGVYFDKKVSEVRDKLDEVRPSEDEPEGEAKKEWTEEELEAELERRIEKKCDQVSTDVERIIDEITETKVELKERIRRSKEDLEDIELLFEPDE